MYENLNIKNPNFCNGPQIGTLCTIDMTNPNTVLRVLDTGGTILYEFSMASNIVDELVGIEYVGPRNLTAMLDGLTFVTVEKIDDDSVIIKRWETDTVFSQLHLKEQVVKRSSGDVNMNVCAFAVEYYQNDLKDNVERTSFLKMDGVGKARNGTRIFIGPSTANENTGASEMVMVSHVAIGRDGAETVYLSNPTRYVYKSGDPVSFYKNVFLFTKEGVTGEDVGVLYKLNPYDWNVIQSDSKKFYRKITSARWCPLNGCIGSVVGTNLLFVDPRNYYLNWRSLFLNNYDCGMKEAFTVFEAVFDGNKIYKLQKKVKKVDNDNNCVTYTWSNYNYQEDSILPYSNSLNVSMDQSIVTGVRKQIRIDCQVRDQYNVGLRDVNVIFEKEGDTGALFSPLSGQAVTDIDGMASVLYTSGSIYNGHTEITGRAVGGIPSTGSPYVFGVNNTISIPGSGIVKVGCFQLKEKIGKINSVKQIPDPYKLPIISGGTLKWASPDLKLFGKSFFTTPGGDWALSKDKGGVALPFYAWKQWLPLHFRGDEYQYDSPFFASPKSGQIPFSCWPFPDGDAGAVYPLSNRITLVKDFYAENRVKCVTYYLIYRNANTTGVHPYVAIAQDKEEVSYMQTSQLKMSKHTHWLEGKWYDFLVTNEIINQFIFVEDAVPKFWSEKNPEYTDVWLRLRPFAFSLDESTLRVWVREVSVYGDSGYYEVTGTLSVEGFDAGGGVSGLEVRYNPVNDFIHGSRVYVRIEAYDTAYDPNFIYVEYWFDVIHDYMAPYLMNLSPGREEYYVPIDTEVRFEIIDPGAGLDVHSLEFLINSRLIHHNALQIEKIDNNRCNVVYRPAENLFFNNRYKIVVKICDVSKHRNQLVDSYCFYTAPSSGVSFVDHEPGACQMGESRFRGVSVVLLSNGDGIDRDSIRMQVYDKDVDPRIIPVIYRIC